MDRSTMQKYKFKSLVISILITIIFVVASLGVPYFTTNFKVSAIDTHTVDQIVDIAPTHGFVGGSGNNAVANSTDIVHYPYARGAMGAKFNGANNGPGGSTISWEQLNNWYGGTQSQAQAINESQKGWPASGFGVKSDDFMAGGGGWDGKVDEYGKDRWPKNNVQPGDITITWGYTARHRTAKYEYFITKQGWSDDGYHIDKNDFERIAFYNKNSESDDFGEDIHKFALPSDRTGYHLMMAVWEIYDTAASFYNLIDLDITTQKENGSITWYDGKTYSKAETNSLDQTKPAQSSDPIETWLPLGPKPGGNDSTQKTTKLDTPSGLRYDFNTNTLKWNSVQHGNDYKIKIVPTESPQDTLISRTNHPKNSFGDQDGWGNVQKGIEYQLTVTANTANGWDESESSSIIFVYGEEGSYPGGGNNGNGGGEPTPPPTNPIQLQPPTNYNYDDTQKELKWQAVQGASSYQIQILDEYGFSKDNTNIARPERIVASIVEQGKSYTAKVKAIGDGTNYKDSDEVEYSFTVGKSSSGGGTTTTPDGGNGNNNFTEPSEGLPGFIIGLIITGGVILLAGVAAVVIVTNKNKFKTTSSSSNGRYSSSPQAGYSNNSNNRVASNRTNIANNNATPGSGIRNNQYNNQSRNNLSNLNNNSGYSRTQNLDSYGQNNNRYNSKNNRI